MRRLQAHADYCTCAECFFRRLNGGGIQPHPDVPTVDVTDLDDMPVSDSCSVCGETHPQDWDAMSADQQALHEANQEYVGGDVVDGEPGPV